MPTGPAGSSTHVAGDVTGDTRLVEDPRFLGVDPDEAELHRPVTVPGPKMSSGTQPGSEPSGQPSRPWVSAVRLMLPCSVAVGVGAAVAGRDVPVEAVRQRTRQGAAKRRRLRIVDADARTGFVEAAVDRERTVGTRTWVHAPTSGAVPASGPSNSQPASVPIRPIQSESSPRGQGGEERPGRQRRRQVGRDQRAIGRNDDAGGRGRRQVHFLRRIDVVGDDLQPDRIVDVVAAGQRHRTSDCTA